MATSNSTAPAKRRRFRISLDRRDRAGKVIGEHPLTGELPRGTAVLQLRKWRDLYPAAKLTAA